MLFVYFNGVEGEMMAVEFTNTADQKIDFGDLVGVRDLQEKIISIDFRLDSWDAVSPTDLVSKASAPSFDGWNINIGGVSHRIQFAYSTDVNVGFWVTDNDSIALDEHYNVAIYFDNSSLSNNPLIYINGISVNVSELAAPAGTAFESDAGQTLKIGSVTYLKKSIDGEIAAVSIYDASNISDIDGLMTNLGLSNLVFPTYAGLVFAPQLYGAAGARDGDTLTSANKILDRVSGALGTPAGSPTFRASNLLSIGADDFR